MNSVIHEYTALPPTADVALIREYTEDGRTQAMMATLAEIRALPELRQEKP